MNTYLLNEFNEVFEICDYSSLFFCALHDIIQIVGLFLYHVIPTLNVFIYLSEDYQKTYYGESAVSRLNIFIKVSLGMAFLVTIKNPRHTHLTYLLLHAN